MYWLLGVAAVGVLAWLSDKENNARRTYYANSERLTKETHSRQQDLANLRQNKALASDFYRHIELHYASVKTANACFELYDEHKQIVKLIGNRESMLREQIIALKKQRDSLPYHQQTQIREQLTAIRQYLAEAKQQRLQLGQEKSQLLEQLRLINEQTRELKQYIGQHCGQKGRNWYAKIEQKKAMI